MASRAVTQGIYAREQRRLAVLADYRVLDFPLDREVTALLRVAASVAGAPKATLHLIDETRQCQPVTVGFEGKDSSRGDSMCAVHFLDGDLVWVPDARLDSRFSANPWVTGRLGQVRFYVSVPILTPDGDALGTLCVFGERPGRLSGDQADRLRDLAAALHAAFARHRQTWVNARLTVSAEEQRTVAEGMIRDVDASGHWPGKTVTRVSPAGVFRGEGPEHQNYLQRYPDVFRPPFPRQDNRSETSSAQVP